MFTSESLHSEFKHGDVRVQVVECYLKSAAALNSATVLCTRFVLCACSIARHACVLDDVRGRLGGALIKVAAKSCLAVLNSVFEWPMIRFKGSKHLQRL